MALASNEGEAVRPSVQDRSDYIGGSEAFELLNETHYGRGCARALAYRKLNTPEETPPPTVGEAILGRGHRLEPFIAKWYMQETKRKLVHRNHLVRHPNHPGAAVHTDRIILASNGKPTGDAELKSHGEGPFLSILRNGLPPSHNLQLQWSFFCTNHTWGAFIICGVFAEMPMKHFDRERDEKLMEIFAREVDGFWNLLARGELPPRLTDERDLRCRVCPYRTACRGETLDRIDYSDLIRETQGKKPITRIEDDELAQLCADRAVIMSELEALDSTSKKTPGALQLITSRIKETLDEIESEANVVEVNGEWLVHWWDTVWTGLDEQRFKREMPEMFERYYVKGRPTGNKTMRIYATRLGKKKQAERE